MIGKNGIITRTITKLLDRGKCNYSLLNRYLQIHYKVSIDEEAFKKRVSDVKKNYICD